MQRHALNTVTCLLFRPEISHVDLIVVPWWTHMVESANYGADGRVTIHAAEIDNISLSQNLWHYRGLPALAARLQPDVLHLSHPVLCMRLRFAAQRCSPCTICTHLRFPAISAYPT